MYILLSLTEQWLVETVQAEHRGMVIINCKVDCVWTLVLHVNKYCLACLCLNKLFLCLLFCFEVDKTVRGEAGSRWNHGRAHHQNSALPRSANQPAVCGQKRRTKAQSSGRSLSVSCFSIHAVLPACHQALVYGAFTSWGQDGMHPNGGNKCNEENNAVCIDCKYLTVGNFQFHCVFELRGLLWSRKWNLFCSFPYTLTHKWTQNYFSTNIVYF